MQRLMKDYATLQKHLQSAFNGQLRTEMADEDLSVTLHLLPKDVCGFFFFFLPFFCLSVGSSLVLVAHLSQGPYAFGKYSFQVSGLDGYPNDAPSVRFVD
jgi:ubiquitin-protein ligase